MGDDDAFVNPEERFALLHRVLAALAIFCMVGLAIQGAFFIPWVLIRYGWAR